MGAGLAVGRGTRRAGQAGRLGGGRGVRLRAGRAGLHDAGLAGAAGRPGLPAAAAGRDPGHVRRAAGQVRAGRGVGGGRAGRAGPRLRRPASAQRHGQPGSHGRHAGGRADRGGRDAAAGLGARGSALLVGAGPDPAGCGLPAPQGEQVRPGPGAEGRPQAAAGEVGQRGRHGPGAGLDHAGLAVLRCARLAADQRVRRPQSARVRAGPGRLLAGLGSRLPDHLRPGRHRAAGTGAHRGAGPGHPVRVRAGRRAGLAGGDDRGRPGLGGRRAGRGPGGRPTRSAATAGRQPSTAPGPRP